MARINNNTKVFLELIKAGLWEKDVKLAPFGKIDFGEVMRLAEEQTIVGLVAAGLDHVVDVKVPKEDALQFVGQALQLEQRNIAMNAFIRDIIHKMRSADIYTLLVKGQGVGQCYERPLWRSCGDVDLLCSQDNFPRAQQFLLQLSSFSKPLERYSKHLGMSIGSWCVEIHGTLRTGLSARVDSEIDEVQNDIFYNGNVRSWHNGDVQVFLPAPDNDVFFVFTHFLMHFYREQMNIRQICDWNRLLWTYRDSLNHKLLELRIRKAGLMSEWKSFAALAVEWLGMPKEAMPLYNNDEKWTRKANRIVYLILDEYTGNTIKDTCQLAKVFPRKTFQYLPSIFLNVNRLKIKERILGL